MTSACNRLWKRTLGAVLESPLDWGIALLLNELAAVIMSISE